MVADYSSDLNFALLTNSRTQEFKPMQSGVIFDLLTLI